MDNAETLPPAEEITDEPPTRVGDDHLAIGALVTVAALLLLCVVIILVAYVRGG